MTGQPQQLFISSELMPSLIGFELCYSICNLIGCHANHIYFLLVLSKYQLWLVMSYAICNLIGFHGQVFPEEITFSEPLPLPQDKACWGGENILKVFCFSCSEDNGFWKYFIFSIYCSRGKGGEYVMARKQKR